MIAGDAVYIIIILFVVGMRIDTFVVPRQGLFHGLDTTADNNFFWIRVSLQARNAKNSRGQRSVVGRGGRRGTFFLVLLLLLLRRRRRVGFRQVDTLQVQRGVVVGGVETMFVVAAVRVVVVIALHTEAALSIAVQETLVYCVHARQC